MCWFMLYPKKETVEHVPPFAIWTDGKRDEDAIVGQEIAYGFFAGERCVVVRVTMTIPHQLFRSFEVSCFAALVDMLLEVAPCFEGGR